MVNSIKENDKQNKELEEIRDTCTFRGKKPISVTKFDVEGTRKKRTEVRHKRGPLLE